MESTSGFIPTRGSAVKKESAEFFESVYFTSHRSQTNKIPRSLNERRTSDQSKNDNLDIKKLRYEVIKFGASGLASSAKEASTVALAVALGAKPPKRKYRNYKEILHAKSLEKSNEIYAVGQKMDPVIYQPKGHYYVSGGKVIPSRLKQSGGSCKKMLDHYGKAGGPKLKRGGMKKGRKRQ